MRLLRTMFLAIGLGALAAACGGSDKKEDTTPATTEMPAEGEGGDMGGDMGAEGAEGAEGVEGAEGAEGADTGDTGADDMGGEAAPEGGE